MKMQWFSRVAIVCTALIAAPAYSSDYLKGLDLYQKCTAPKHSVSDGYCNAYIQGFLDGLFINTDNVDTMLTKLCTKGEGITLLGARSIIEKYMKEHKDQLDKFASTVVGFALLQVYKCPK